MIMMMESILILLLFSLPLIVKGCEPQWVGDGYCDSSCNNRENKFDDGDCCEYSCIARPRTFPCGSNDYDCRIPPAPTPTWFTRDTQLCYKWRADGNGGQCGAGEPRELCAHVGNHTQFYRDDTDGRGGGCRMQWSIRSPFAPSWFSTDVRICYRWYADGNGGQCGGGAKRLLCSTVGSYTPEYRDDTDNRGGGCRMSWKLFVPTDAPNWLRNVQLCYLWYPDGNGGQCGGGVDRELCARANHWTTYYRDDTDNRSGGCRMAWELRL